MSRSLTQSFRARDNVMNKELINRLRLDAGIAQVANSAKLVVINRDGNIIDPIVGLEKFAELIIEECIKICEDMDGVDNFEQMMNPRTPRYDCVCEIKEHFGVE